METLLQGCEGGLKWHWYSVMSDLEGAGVKVTIDPLSIRDYFGAGRSERGDFTYTWVKDTLLMLSMKEDYPLLVEGFAKVVGYRPFCKYVSKVSGMLTYEWDKADPERRFAELQLEGELQLKRTN